VNQSSYEQLIDRLAGGDGPNPAIADLILAATEGAETLDAHLSGGPAPERRESAGAREPPAPARVYLEQIGVQNFRGIGPAARLQLAACLTR
jgi:hypothetical protein